MYARQSYSYVLCSIIYKHIHNTIPDFNIFQSHKVCRANSFFGKKPLKCYDKEFFMRPENEKKQGRCSQKK